MEIIRFTEAAGIAMTPEAWSQPPALLLAIWNSDDEDAVTGASIRIRLEPGQSMSIDSPDSKSLTVKCADHDEKLSAVYTNQQFASKQCCRSQNPKRSLGIP